MASEETLPYKFTGKELDKETGLYYFGARYYDARLSRWISTDPALQEGKYFTKPNDFDTEHDFYWYLQQDGSRKLAGMGGVFNAINLDSYHYAGQNPVKLVDPDGRQNLPHFTFEIPEVTWLHYKLQEEYGERYQFYGKKTEPNMFTKIMTIAAVELTPMGLVSRVALGKDPYDGKALTAKERVKEGAKAVAFGAVRNALKAGHAVANMGQLVNPKLVEKMKSLKWGSVITAIYEKLDSLRVGFIKFFMKENK